MSDLQTTVIGGILYALLRAIFRLLFGGGQLVL
jgi:hypothetical protein